MRTINFNEEDIKQCKLALAKQNLTSLQSAFLMQYITNIEQENEQLKDNWNKLREYIDIKLYNMEYLQKLCGCRLDDEIHIILDIIKKEMQELEENKNE